MEKNLKNISKEIAAIAEQVKNYAETINLNGKEYKLTENNIDEDMGWWRGGNTLSQPNVYECENKANYGGKEQVLYFKFGYGFERESTAHVIVTEDDTYMVIDGKVFRVAYIISHLELVYNFNLEELRDVLDSRHFILQNTNGKYVYVEHVEKYWPINYFELKFNKPCESISIEEYDKKYVGGDYHIICRSNGKVTARYEY